MASELLVREKLEETGWDAAIHQERLQLVRDAESLLSYLTPTKDNPQTISLDEKLRRAMLELDIRPFSKESVDTYKQAELKRQTPRWASLLADIGMVCVLLSLVGFVSLGLCGVCSAGFWLFGAVPGWFENWALGSVAWIAGTFAAAVLLVGPTSSSIPKWTAVRIQDYRAAIPEYALQTAVDIRKRVPEVQVLVESLGYDTRAYDPFLIVQTLGGPHYYVEVWNEPGFRGQREV